MLRRAFFVAITLCSAAVLSGADPSLGELHEEQRNDQRECTADDLLPDRERDGDLADMWDQDTLVTSSFDCSCNTLKAR